MRRRSIRASIARRGRSAAGRGLAGRAVAVGVLRGGEGSRRTGRARRSSAGRRSRSRSPRSRRSLPPRRGSSTSTSRPARRARRCATCSRTPPGCPSTARTPIAEPGRRRIYSNTGFEVLAEAVAAARRDAVRGLPARGGARAARDAAPSCAARRRRAARHPRRPRCALGRELQRAEARRARDARRGDLGPVPRPRSACCRTSAAWTRTTGASASSCATRSSRTGPATRNSPRTFGHFGGSGTFLWVDPEADVALACLTDRDFGPWALEAWPALSDAVLG